MDEPIDNINLEIHLFQKKLKSFSKRTNELNEKTLTLLNATISNIDELIGNAKLKSANGNTDDDFDLLANVNENFFEYRHVITCCLCHIQISLSKHEFDAHIQSKLHKAKEVQRLTVQVTPPSSIASNELSLTLSDNYVDSLKKTEFNNNTDKNNKQLNDSTVMPNKNFDKLVSSHETTDAINEIKIFSSVFDSENKSSFNGKKFHELTSISCDSNDSKNGILTPLQAYQYQPPAFSIFAQINANERNTTVIEENLPDLVNTEDVKQLINDFIINAGLEVLGKENEIIMIITSLTNALNSLNDAVSVLFTPFGSRMYGLGSTNSDINIIVDFSSSDETVLNESMSNKIQLITKRINDKFGDIFAVNEIDATNHYLHLSLLHKPSHIDCRLSFDNCDGDSAKSTRLLLDFNKNEPMFRYVTAYLIIWQDKLNHSCSEGGFKFSTYLLALLVISLFQMRDRLLSGFNLQTIDPNTAESHLNSSQSIGVIDNIEEYLLEFFDFYGTTYQYKNHVISPYIGKLQFRKIIQPLNEFTPAQLRLKKAMLSNPEEWNNCFMCVQDLLTPDRNVASKVRQDEVVAFQMCCRAFAHLMRRNYLKHLTKKANGSVAVPAMSISNAAIREETSELIETNIPIADSLSPVINKILCRGITLKANQYIIHAEKFMKISNDQTVLCDLKSHYLKIVNMYAYGSYVNNVGTCRSDLNIFIDCANMNNNSKQINTERVKELQQQSIETLKKSPTIWTSIKEIYGFANSYSVEVVHIATNVRCNLTFQTGAVVSTWKLINHFLKIQPICRQMIMYLRYWLDQININVENTFKFNGYLITVLVISFFQINHLLPSVCTLQTNIKKVNSGNVYVHFNTEVLPVAATGSFDKWLLNFFTFYGHTLNPSTDIVSPYHGKLMSHHHIIKMNDKVNSLEELASLKMMKGNLGLWKAKHFYVQDIFRRNLNISADITKDEIASFQKCCQLSCLMLKK